MLRYNGTEREAQPGACTGGSPRTLRPPLANKRAFCRQPLRTIANLRNSIDTDCSLCTSFSQGLIFICRIGNLKQTWPNVVINKLVLNC